MQDSLFRMYDMRGKVGSELIIDETYDLVRAIAYYFASKNSSVKNVVVGTDGRTHSPAIKEFACKALQDSGLNVLFIGVVPSPLVYFALNTMDVDAGIMITASHNPKEYNGFKTCLGKESLWGDAIQEIKELYKAKKFLQTSEPGTYSEYEIIPIYLDYISKLFPHLIGMQFPVVFDCGNGATGAVMPDLVKKMQWSHAQLLCAEVDGNYPHHEADPVVEENMQDVKNVLAMTDAQMGIGFDGDGDRMAAMTKSGYLVPGDQMLAIFSEGYLKKSPGASVVCDIKSSSVLLDVVGAHGGIAHLSPSGHSLIKKNMKLHGSRIGGELSGHFFFYDRFFGYDDAIYAALRLLEILVQSGKGLEYYVGRLPRKISSQEYRIACDEEKKIKIVQAVYSLLLQRQDAKIITIDGIRMSIPAGMGVLRASNTQPVLSLRFEADSEQGLHEVKEVFVHALEPYLNGIELRKELQLVGRE